jgi:hypothetical protein
MAVINLSPPKFAPQASEVDILKGNWIEKHGGVHVCIARFSGCENQSLRHGKTSDAFWCVMGNVFQAAMYRNTHPFGRAEAACMADAVDSEASWGKFMTVAYDRVGGYFVVFTDPKGYGRIRYRINEAGCLQIHYRDHSSAYPDPQSRPMGRFRRHYRLDVERLNFERLSDSTVLVFKDGEIEIHPDFDLGPARTLYEHMLKASV